MTYKNLDEVTALAQSMIGTSTSEDRNLFRQWAWEAMQDLGVATDDIKVCTKKVKNLLAPKPEDMRLLLELTLYDSSGCQLKHVFRTGVKRIYQRQDPAVVQVTEDGTSDYLYPTIDVSEDRYNIIIGTNGTAVDSVHIRYFAYPLDKDGYPLIRQDEVMAIVYFIRHAWAMRKNDNVSEREQAYSWWLRESDRCRARKKCIHPEQADSIFKVWNTLLPNRNFRH